MIVFNNFFLILTIYYIEYVGRPWQLQCNYVQKNPNNMKKKKKKRKEKKRREKGTLARL